MNGGFQPKIIVFFLKLKKKQTKNRLASRISRPKTELPKLHFTVMFEPDFSFPVDKITNSKKSPLCGS